MNHVSLEDGEMRSEVYNVTKLAIYILYYLFITFKFLVLYDNEKPAND